MTKEEIDQIESCQATNILLAEKIMLSRQPKSRPKNKTDRVSPSGAWFYSASDGWIVQNFSSDIDAAMMIAEQVYRRFIDHSEICGLNLMQVGLQDWAASFCITLSDDMWYEDEHINNHLACARGNTPALAIARAALKAVLIYLDREAE